LLNLHTTCQPIVFVQHYILPQTVKKRGTNDASNWINIINSNVGMLIVRIVQQTYNKQTNRQTDKQTNRQTDKQTNRQTNRITNQQANKQTNRQTNRLTNQQANKQTNNKQTRS
jgi:hypothetical protein